MLTQLPGAALIQSMYLGADRLIGPGQSCPRSSLVVCFLDVRTQRSQDVRCRVFLFVSGLFGQLSDSSGLDVACFDVASSVADGKIILNQE